MTSIKAPCILSKNVAFIDPGKAAKRSLDAATEMCHQCPMLQQCALDALHGGNSLDGNMTRPATDVLQAGFHCRGDARTARKLAAIAGVPTPPEYRDQAPRNFAPDQCVNCKKPMHKWTRHPEEIPAGHVMAYARGFCTGCRTAYKAHLDVHREHDPESLRIRKPIDRKRHHPETAAARARTAGHERRRLEPGWITVKQATEQLGVHRTAVARIAERYTVPVLKGAGPYGADLFYEVELLAAYAHNERRKTEQRHAERLRVEETDRFFDWIRQNRSLLEWLRDQGEILDQLDSVRQQGVVSTGDRETVLDGAGKGF